jgi:esterase/lipase superfamily enzyme
MNYIIYTSGYKYQLKQPYSVVIPIKPRTNIVTEYISLSTDGTLSIKAGYAWDGLSGPTINTLTVMRGSLVHNALYQLMNNAHLDFHIYRETADRLLQEHCKEDGMSSIRAWWIYHCARLFTSPSAAPSSKRQLFKTPVADCVIVRVFFATDRSRNGNKNPDEMFGANRSNLTYGTCEVSIPREHRMGELESPSIWRLEFRADPAKHVVLLKVAIASKDKFFADMAARVRQSNTSNTFLFVHGYNVTFADAARRTAQITYDLAFDGAPIFYSWPSQGLTPAYTIDEQNIEWSQANLRNFLEDVFTHSDAQNVYLIAHSMGNRALTRAVASLLTEKPDLRSRLKEVILTAPDIDADVFKRDIAPVLAAASRSVTLYASSQDLALVASKKVHGYPRAGDSGQGLVVVPWIETVDATSVDTSLLGHSYFAESRSVLSDIYYLIHEGKRADQRFGLRPIDAHAGRYWEFKP